MIQYNLRLDKKLKTKAQFIAQKEGMSENLFYNKAIEDYVRRQEQEDFVSRLFKRHRSDQHLKSLLSKIRKSKRLSLYKEDVV